MKRSLALAALAALAPLLVSCSKGKAPSGPPPTEKLALVVTPASPLLAKPEAKKPAIDVLYAGDLVYAVSPVTEKNFDRIDWKGVIDGATEAHSGATYLVHRAFLDGPSYGFRADFPSEIDVPERGWVCAEIKRAAPAAKKSQLALEACADTLRRARLPSGAFAAYIPCQIGDCPVALVQGSAVQVIAVDGLLTVRPTALPDGGGDALIVTRRFVRDDGAWTGGHLAVLGFEAGAPVQRAEIALDDIDARDPALVKNRVVSVVVTPGGVELKGERRHVLRASGSEEAKEPIHERYKLTREGLLPRL